MDTPIRKKCPCKCGQFISPIACMCTGPMSDDGHCVGDRLLAQEHEAGGYIGESGSVEPFRPSIGPMSAIRRAEILALADALEAK